MQYEMRLLTSLDFIYKVAGRKNPESGKGGSVMFRIEKYLTGEDNELVTELTLREAKRLRQMLDEAIREVDTESQGVFNSFQFRPTPENSVILCNSSL